MISCKKCIFDIFKKTFQELQGKIELKIILIPNLVCCCLLHNLLIGHHEINMKQILNLLQEIILYKTINEIIKQKNMNKTLKDKKILVSIDVLS